jgi:hypothetical protein
MSSILRRAHPAVLAFLFGLGLLLPGCGPSKLTKENFDKIKPGMTVQQVEEVLGSGSPQGGDGANVAAQFGVDVGASAPPPSTVDYLWEKGPKSVTVTFKGGKVVGSKSKGL